jgi:hypothetical protein
VFLGALIVPEGYSGESLLQNNAFDAVFQAGDVEIDQISQADVGKFEVGEKLRLVERDHLFHGF